MYELASESARYRKLRAELLEAEIALKDQRERVAALRRRLPTGTPVPDYELRCLDLARPERETRSLKLSQLFGDASKPLVLMHFMFGEAQRTPCPMCTMWADGYDGVIPHLEQRLQLAVVVAGDLDRFADHARTRGWRNLRLTSSAGTSLKTDLGMQDPDGGQRPGASVFTLAEDGSPRHFYTGGALMAEQHFRGMDLLSPVWSFFDLLPEGRGEWLPALEYAD